MIREVAKKFFFRSPVKDGPLRKTNFFEALKKKSPKNVATQLEGRGGKALVVGPLKKPFFAASLIIYGSSDKKELHVWK